MKKCRPPSLGLPNDLEWSWWRSGAMFSRGMPPTVWTGKFKARPPTASTLCKCTPCFMSRPVHLNLEKKAPDGCRGTSRCLVGFPPLPTSVLGFPPGVPSEAWFLQTLFGFWIRAMAAHSRRLTDRAGTCRCLSDIPGSCIIDIRDSNRKPENQVQSVTNSYLQGLMKDKLITWRRMLHPQMLCFNPCSCRVGRAARH